ncbi:GLPGLI family protein, partial [Salmonella enterica]|uniref:GLPGLI family protein n=1 Tax=Salmonella enterica TaxID=28901 RepID=UPI003CF98FCF
SAVIFEKNIHIFQPNLGSAVRARYEEEIPKLDWHITSEEKEIGGYKSQKATVSYRGREWTAWFTEELP